MFILATFYHIKLNFDPIKMDKVKKSNMPARLKFKELGPPVDVTFYPFPQLKAVENLNRFIKIEKFKSNVDWIDEGQANNFYQLWYFYDKIPSRNIFNGDNVPWHKKFCLVKKEELYEQFKKLGLSHILEGLE